MMRKTIELTDEDIQAVEEYQKENKLKNFSEAVRGMLRGNQCKCQTQETLSDENFALIADALVTIDDKLNIVVGSIAPKHAGEITKG